MLRSFVIALVIVAPFWWVLRKRIAARRTPPPVEAPPSEASPPTLEAVIDEITRMGAEGRARSDARLTVRVPHGATIGGDPAPPEVVDAIVRDALSRSGLVPTAELDTGTARVIECRPKATSSAAD